MNAMGEDVSKLAELTFCGRPIKPDFTELKRTARELAEVLCAAFDIPPHKREPFIQGFVDRAVSDTADWLVEMYGAKGQ